MLRICPTAIALLALAAPLFASLAAAPAKQAIVSGKVDRSNVQVRLIVHPQVDRCTPELVREVRKRALELGQAHVRANLAKLIKQAGTDASGDKEFFGVSYLVGCPGEGVAWIAFPVEGKDARQVSRYAPGLGWSPMTRL